MAVALFISLFAVLLSKRRAMHSFFSVTVFRGGKQGLSAEFSSRVYILRV